MDRSSNLKSVLESSLNEIFKSTVSDILESVDQTLSEYQGKIQRIETENEDLRRKLYGNDNRIGSERMGVSTGKSTLSLGLMSFECYCCVIVLRLAAPLVS